jgi:hypothetical protein
VAFEVCGTGTAVAGVLLSARRDNVPPGGQLCSPRGGRSGSLAFPAPSWASAVAGRPSRCSAHRAPHAVPKNRKRVDLRGLRSSPEPPLCTDLAIRAPRPGRTSAASLGIRAEGAFSSTPPTVSPLHRPAARASTPTGLQAARLRRRGATLAVPFRPRGFSPPRRLPPLDRSRACCIPLPILGFAAFHRTTRSIRTTTWVLRPSRPPRSPRRVSHPSKFPLRSQPYRVTAAVAPLVLVPRSRAAPRARRCQRARSSTVLQASSPSRLCSALGVRDAPPPLPATWRPVLPGLRSPSRCFEDRRASRADDPSRSACAPANRWRAMATRLRSVSLPTANRRDGAPKDPSRGSRAARKIPGNTPGAANRWWCASPAGGTGRREDARSREPGAADSIPPRVRRPQRRSRSLAARRAPPESVRSRSSRPFADLALGVASGCSTGPSRGPPWGF